MFPKIKICCISSLEEAHLAVQLGASALGLVAKMPSGPGPISDELIREIAAAVPPPIASFLLTSRTDITGIAEHQRAVGTNTVQIVDALSEGTYAQLRLALPGISIVQVIHVVDEKSVDEALEIAPQVDALLLDSGNPNLAVKELGGTGRVHNWALSRQIVEQSSKPVFLAGGLNAENVKVAMDAVQPWGLDLCSGVRSNGNLDPVKLEAFFRAVYG
ncbi:phosphoribosylanthranilate isomerase [Haliscomenobacter hydrossis]|uniref:N-(5'-phosphoribosyl)anthranilate isomerase n=1 Tax=Haliscomenobacter hydrossis (strain ATCC 27775 / DSM 1100 / LMG 10767 / O) TaxID=760192 RepID=F4L582_HALH1|nr:phosphoribosylanthranilate isomerase [Haliscomenobacter hydrossis]AEE49762.1 Phosphoribosylanthranilate isomerase [Haliscomenobacter hydrossis DSM 1100]